MPSGLPPREVTAHIEQLGKDGTHADIGTHVFTKRLCESSDAVGGSRRRSTGQILEELADNLDALDAEALARMFVAPIL